MDNHKLFVGNMAARITQRDLWRFFSSYGLIDECAKFHESYAFIRYVHADDAKRARQETHGAMLKGRKLKVEFAANLNRSNSSSATDQQKYFYVEPLRRTTNTPIYYSPLKSSPTISDHKKVHNRIFSSNLSNNEEFLTPDLLRLAGIQPSLSSSSDDGYETNSSPILNNSYDSRFFPMSIRQHNIYSNTLSDQSNRRNADTYLLSLDFARIRLFSDISSGFGDESNSFIE
ncbi:unnamed protein product [Rotaria magnacalcarata]|uniref:RRM domain-containing protein n=1 Tax=Rotaria magnacalcarata TaxID=392030 RepID=A0A816Z6E9_9BILA|nr:unnamed protein product [Rotaria magnacalcarata]CAF2187939.1 unnamed protein product [Rotaria magnacalcarata]CAF3760082.1 unnamed protein product [Rotaria magnacalcarata]CAF3842194.1 unnamed protein product [Rotaria magnacalcarata]